MTDTTQEKMVRLVTRYKINWEQMKKLGMALCAIGIMTLGGFAMKFIYDYANTAVEDEYYQSKMDFLRDIVMSMTFFYTVFLACLSCGMFGFGFNSNLPDPDPLLAMTFLSISGYFFVSAFWIGDMIFSWKSTKDLKSQQAIVLYHSMTAAVCAPYAIILVPFVFLLCIKELGKFFKSLIVVTTEEVVIPL